MNVLSIDTATKSISVAVQNEESILGEFTLNYKKQHSVILMPLVQNLLRDVGLKIDDIDGFVISKGPGSFTGLRIGIATVKGLSQGTNKPFIGVSSLDALAYNIVYNDGIICPVIDALHNNVYTCLYSYENNKLKKISDYMIIHIDKLIELLKEKNTPVYFAGEVSHYLKEKTTELNSAIYAPLSLNIIKASSLGEIGLNMLMTGKSDNVLSFAPIYILKSQAEREYERKLERTQNA